MTRKSPARVKPIKTDNAVEFEKPELPPIEETFDNYKQVFLTTAKVAHDISKRAKNFSAVRRFAYEFWGSDHWDAHLPGERMRYFHKMHDLSVEVYGKIVETVEGFELGEFLKDDMKDYFDHLIPKPEDVETEQEMFEMEMIYDIVEPWGNKMSQMHQNMLNERDLRKEQEL